MKSFTKIVFYKDKIFDVFYKRGLPDKLKIYVGRHCIYSKKLFYFDFEDDLEKFKEYIIDILDSLPDSFFEEKKSNDDKEKKFQYELKEWDGKLD